MSPNPNRLWQCGNHIPVHVAMGNAQRKEFSANFQCKKWREKKLPANDPVAGGLLPVLWKCGNHSSPAHVAHNGAEKDNFTQNFNCKKWHVVFAE